VGPTRLETCSDSPEVSSQLSTSSCSKDLPRTRATQPGELEGRCRTRECPVFKAMGSAIILCGGVGEAIARSVRRAGREESPNWAGHGGR